MEDTIHFGVPCFETDVEELLVRNLSIPMNGWTLHNRESCIGKDKELITTQSCYLRSCLAWCPETAFSTVKKVPQT